MQPRHITRRESGERRREGQEFGLVEPLFGLARTGHGVQVHELRVGSRRCAAGEVKVVQHMVQPVAVVALFDLGVELVFFAQAQQVEREEAVRAGAQGFAGAGRQTLGQQARRTGCAAVNRCRCNRQVVPRVVPGRQRAALLRERQRQPFEQRAGGERIGAVGTAAQEGEARRAQRLPERQALGVALLRGVGQAEREHLRVG